MQQAEHHYIKILLHSYVMSRMRLTHFAKLGPIYHQLSLAVSPDDCSLALRGLQTLAVCPDALGRAALQVAIWLSDQPLVDQVYHPALASCLGHDIWARDFSGSASIFSFTFISIIKLTKAGNFINML